MNKKVTHAIIDGSTILGGKVATNKALYALNKLVAEKKPEIIFNKFYKPAQGVLAILFGGAAYTFSGKLAKNPKIKNFIEKFSMGAMIEGGDVSIDSVLSLLSDKSPKPSSLEGTKGNMSITDGTPQREVRAIGYSSPSARPQQAQYTVI